MKIDATFIKICLLCSPYILFSDGNEYSDKTIKNVKLPASLAIAPDKTKTYQSDKTLSQSFLLSNPSGNGDITSILRILPNVQFDNAQLRSTTLGEIDPANISISGGLFLSKQLYT
ncbi:hypothetical protein OQH61_00135 [Helicobacter sp. MIT 21-1697]|uniref:hypothetical protein n=1 Tax=Helicobacter sp. MIT 21-1697 TaxID=2993733 RepID=UPI00224AB417|nr:hypothetical protein [Helicobacter sp. MIT 21-1697]MCX2716148.1 hypothetical protein [Helicobacter sp. MIT 21-1697]